MAILGWGGGVSIVLSLTNFCVQSVKFSGMLRCLCRTWSMLEAEPVRSEARAENSVMSANSSSSAM